MDDYPVWSMFGQPTVHSEDPAPKWSGLYDHQGTPLYRQPERVGFDIERIRRQSQTVKTS